MSVDPNRVVDRYSYRGGDLVVLRPVIDKLIFDYNFQDCPDHKDKIKKIAVEQNIPKLLKTAGLSFRKTTNDNVGYKRNSHLHAGYHLNYVLRYKPTGSKIIVQLDPVKGKSGGFFRFTLNPDRLGIKGLAFFANFVEQLTKNSHQTITFKSMSTVPKTIKRIDIAVDMLGVDASDLEGKYVYKNKKLKKHQFQNDTGRVETNYFVMPENDKNQAYWYNKLKSYKDLADDPVKGGQRSPYGKALYTRFEYRIRETDKPIANLKSFLNHLPKVKFRAIDYNKIQGSHFTHPLFLRYALGRTRSKALDMIPKEYQAEYAGSYDKAIVNIWKPELIWEKGWLQELEHLGLLDKTIPGKKPKLN